MIQQSRDIPRQNQIRLWKKHMHSVLTTARFTTARKWKQCKNPPSDEWVKEMGYVYTTGISHKNNEISSPTTTWMGLEATGTSEMIKTQKDK